MAFATKLKPAELKYPNGGGLQAMANGNSKIQELEMEALLKKHEVEIAKLKDKHDQANKPAATPTKANK